MMSGKRAIAWVRGAPYLLPPGTEPSIKEVGRELARWGADPLQHEDEIEVLEVLVGERWIRVEGELVRERLLGDRGV